MSGFIHREVGENIPISIGTSLAIDGLFNEHPDTKNKPKELRQVEALEINVTTLVRNFHQCVENGATGGYDLTTAASLLQDEFQAIRQYIRDKKGQSFPVSFYYQTLDWFNYRFPNAKRKEPKTDRQKIEARVIDMLVNFLVERSDESAYIKTIGERFPQSTNTTALLTHYPHNLLHRFDFKTLFLLESHTGKLKNHTLFYTKLHTLKKNVVMPFNAFTMQLYGEGTLLSTFPFGLKQELETIASAKRWTVATTRPKIENDLADNASDVLRDTYVSLMKRVTTHA